MPWCPKCKNEYVDGIRMCSDCGCELTATKVGSTEWEDNTAIEEDLHDGNYSEDETEDDSSFHVEKTGSETEDGADNKHAAEMTGRLMAPGKERIYEDSASKAIEFKSGAYMLIITGGIGLAALVLVLADVTPVILNSTSKIMSGIVMGALFLIFIVMGFLSLKSSKSLAHKAVKESELKAELEKWCKENLSTAIIDDAIEDLPEAEEARYFKRSAYMHRVIEDKFPNLEPAFLDYFVDEIYPNLFEA